MQAALLLCLLTYPTQDPFSARDSAPARTLLGDEPVVVDCDFSTGWPVVDVRIGEHDPVPMILDTGSGAVVLDADFAEELGLAVVGETRVGDPSNPTAVKVDVVTLETLHLGDAEFTGLRALSWDRPASMRRGAVRGILGMPLFADCLVTIDRAAGTVRMERGTLPEPDGREVLAVRRDDFGALNIDIDVAGHRVEAHLDSGNVSGIVLPGRLESELPLVAGSQRRGGGRRASGPVEFTVAQLDGDVRIGALTLTRPEVRLDSSLPFANIGGELLERCALTIDLASSRIRLRPYPPEPTRSEAASQRRVVRGAPTQRRLGARMRPRDDGTMEVVGLDPGLLGLEVGMRAGDVLLKVGEQAVRMSDMQPLVAALSSSDPFQLVVERDGELVTLDVPAADAPRADALLTDGADAPLQVFLLVGQSNMQGKGKLDHLRELATAPGTKERYGHWLRAGEGEPQWAERDDVWIDYLGKRGALAPGYGSPEDRFGPELEIGRALGDALEAPVLLIKLAWGGKSLAVDFRPPGRDGETGPYYTEALERTRALLADPGVAFPALAGRKHELAGIIWFQGWNDRVNQAFNDEYEANLAQLVRDLRQDLGAPALPFVIGETGQGGVEEEHPRALSLMAAQAAVAEYPEFADDVRFVETKPFYESEPAHDGGYHFFGNAANFFGIGEALGKAMVELIEVRSGGR